MRCAVAVLLSAVVAAGAVHGQSLRRYTETQTGPDQVALGFPVPRPVASLTPVDGFRDYASLDARLQGLALQSEDLAAHRVGSTQQYGRPVYAYIVSDPDATDGEGRPEPVFVINAATHAREWGAPEVSTALVERMVAGAGDGALVRYLLDNTRLLIIPIHNVDGLLQTQRYPDQVILGADPRFPSEWPRDGRMRRKNMRGADESLTSFGDHLQGVDLNRNHPPYWATSNRSSPNPADLVYHGPGPHSEAENRALGQALALVPADRVRLGIDIHSFSQVFFSSNTGNARTNLVQTALLQLLSAHHGFASRGPNVPGGAIYTDIQDPPNVGIGTASEYFSETFGVPAWTLELEPVSSAAQYGGFNVSHSGFILPDSEARRVREAWAESHLVAFYYMAGPPHLARVRVSDAGTGAPVLDREWRRAGNARVLTAHVAQPLLPGRRYRVELQFDKPMRHRDGRGAVVPLAGTFPGRLPVGVELLVGSAVGPVETGGGRWRPDGARYRDDRFVFEWNAPSTPGSYRLRVDAYDMVGHRLDADPSTPVDWGAGAWSGWEDGNGVAGDSGGPDSSFAFEVAAEGTDLIGIGPVPETAGEGDRLRIVLERPSPTPGVSAQATWNSCVGDAVQCDFIVGEGPLTWAAGEGGERTIEIDLPDDLQERPAQSGRLQVSTTVGGAPASSADFAFEVLDNDDGPPVRRARDAGTLAALLEDGDNPAAEVVLDGDIEYRMSAGSSAVLEFASPVRIFGNRARLGWPVEGVVTNALTLEDAIVDPRGLGLDNAPVLLGVPDGSAGSITVKRSAINSSPTTILTPTVPNPLHWAIGGRNVRIHRSTVRTPLQAGAAANLDEGGTIDTSTLLGGDSPAVGVQGAASASGSTLTGWRLTTATGAGSLAVTGSAMVSGGGTDACAAPKAIGGGGNLFWLDGDGDWLASGCIAPATSDTVSSGDAAVLGSAPSWPQRPYLLPDPVGPLVDAVPPEAGCGPVDQRGAPRPQALVDGAEALCDIGAIELGLNPWRGLWIPDRSGHGVDIHTAGNNLFITWYTYGNDGQPAAYLATAPLTGPVWRAPLLSSRLPGGQFPNEVFEVGEVEIAFASDTEATLRWRFGDGAWGEEGLHAYAFADGEPRFETTGTWYAPTQSGYGITITRRGAVTGAVVYYYDAGGVLRWVLGSGGDGDVIDLAMLGFTGFCPDCDAQAMPATAREVGRMRLHFLTPERARIVSMDWVYPGANGGLWQRANVPLVPLNWPVDNREAAVQLEAAERR